MSGKARASGIATARRGLIGAAALLLACRPASQEGAPISQQELLQRIEAGDAPVILDVRTAAEYQAGHLPGSVNVPHEQLASRLPELGLEESQEVVVHCQGGKRAAIAEEILTAAGYTRVRDLEGHYQGWQAAGLPTE